MADTSSAASKTRLPLWLKGFRDKTGTLEWEYIDTTNYVAMVRGVDGAVIYFDPTEIAQYQFLGYTDAQAPAYRLFYKNGTAEDMIDAYGVIPTAQ